VRAEDRASGVAARLDAPLRPLEAGWLRSPWLALPLGALQSLAFAPFGAWPLGILCLAALFWLWRDATPRRAAWTGFAFVGGLFLAGTYWLYVSIHIFGRAPVPLALFLMLGMVAIMGSYAAAVGWALARWFPRAGLLAGLLVLPAAWVGWSGSAAGSCRVSRGWRSATARSTRGSPAGRRWSASTASASRPR
jgi:apolipoprotein N-acyltransferase